jgi:hypothetical protein
MIRLTQLPAWKAAKRVVKNLIVATLNHDYDDFSATSMDIKYALAEWSAYQRFRAHPDSCICQTCRWVRQERLTEKLPPPPSSEHRISQENPK